MTHIGVNVLLFTFSNSKAKANSGELDYPAVAVWFRGFKLYVLLACPCSNALIDCDGAADEMPELSDGDDGDDEEQWQWMEEGDTEQVNVPCLFCDRWDYATINAPNNLGHPTVSQMDYKHAEILKFCKVLHHVFRRVAQRSIKLFYVD